MLPGARAVPVVPAARHAARLFPGPSAAPAAPAAAGLSPRSAGPAGARENGARRVYSGWRGALWAWRGPGGGPRDEVGFVSGASRLLALTF